MFLYKVENVLKELLPIQSEDTSIIIPHSAMFRVLISISVFEEDTNV